MRIIFIILFISFLISCANQGNKLSINETASGVRWAERQVNGEYLAKYIPKYLEADVPKVLAYSSYGVYASVSNKDAKTINEVAEAAIASCYKSLKGSSFRFGASVSFPKCSIIMVNNLWASDYVKKYQK